MVFSTEFRMSVFPSYTTIFSTVVCSSSAVQEPAQLVNTTANSTRSQSTLHVLGCLPSFFVHVFWNQQGSCSTLGLPFYSVGLCRWAPKIKTTAQSQHSVNPVRETSPHVECSSRRFPEYRCSDGISCSHTWLPVARSDMCLWKKAKTWNTLVCSILHQGGWWRKASMSFLAR